MNSDIVNIIPRSSGYLYLDIISYLDSISGYHLDILGHLDIISLRVDGFGFVTAAAVVVVPPGVPRDIRGGVGGVPRDTSGGSGGALCLWGPQRHHAGTTAAVVMVPPPPLVSPDTVATVVGGIPGVPRNTRDGCYQRDADKW